MFDRFRCWLRGTFVCTECGGTFQVSTFGYGTSVCPDCYEGEQPIVTYDEEYWLNRLLSRLTSV